MTRGRISLHARMAIVLTLMLAVVAASLYLGARQNARALADENIDAQLRQIALTVAATSAGWLNEARRDAIARPPDTGADGTPFDDPRAGVFALRRPDGAVLVRSPGFPRTLSLGPAGYAERQAGGRNWRVLSRRLGDQEMIVQVAIDTAAADSRAAAIGARLNRSLLWLLPLLAVIGLVALWQGLAPVRRLRAALARVDARRPVPLGLSRTAVPAELAGLTQAIDDLMHRLARVLERQRIFSAAANHELRTPLAGCRSQIEVVRRATDGHQRGAALDRIDERIAYMTHLAGQLQTLAEASHVEMPAGRCELAPLIRRRVVEQHERAAGRDIGLDVVHLAEATIAGDETLTASLVDNLLTNAIAVSAPGGTVEIRLDETQEAIVLRVSDDGPGTHEIADRLFEPFFQANDGKPGAGLGLAIVHGVAETQNATVAFDNDAPRHGVVVRWPRPSPGPLSRTD